MNDRMQIAKDMMREMLRINNEIHYEDAAAEAVRYADALLKALAESEAERPQFTTGAHDEVGDWRKYVRPDGKRALMHAAAGNMAYVDDAFIWRGTPQGFDFWRAIADGNASALTITRAQDFARRVLEAMEADGE